MVRRALAIKGIARPVHPSCRANQLEEGTMGKSEHSALHAVEGPGPPKPT